MCKGDTFITLLAIAACVSPLCRSCLLAQCCGSACSCPCRWRDSCGWSTVASHSGWPGSCMGGGGVERSRSELSGGRWWAGGENKGEFRSLTSLLLLGWWLVVIRNALTRSTLMIWNFCVMSAGLEGNLDLPLTKRRKSTRSSLVNSSRLCQNQPISWWLSVTSR